MAHIDDLEGNDNDFITVIQEEMEQRLPLFSDAKTISIFCGTWNVNDRVYNFESSSSSESKFLQNWLLPEYPRKKSGADLYVVAFQETVHLNTYNVVFSDESINERIPFWQATIENTLALTQNEPEDPYVFVTGRHLVGLLVICYIKKSLLPYLTNLRVCSVPLGVMGILGNKGGISLRFNLHYNSFCFIGSHFHPNRENIGARNADFQTIMERTLFLPQRDLVKMGTWANPSPAETPPSGAVGLESNVEKKEKKAESVVSSSSELIPPFHRWADEGETELIIDNHNFVFWLGDLNYRIEDSLTTEMVFAEVENIPFLREKDQLNQERLKGNVFGGFNEGLLTFPPTYKFEPGTNTYDRRPDKKLRAPAWCDRILWKTSPLIDPASVELNSYFSAPVLLSDHLPVGGIYDCQCRQIDPPRELTVYQEVLAAMDRWENAKLPKLEMPIKELDFGTVSFRNRSPPQEILLKNSGTARAVWSLAPKWEGASICESWVRVFPMKGVILPGETQRLSVIVEVSESSFLPPSESSPPTLLEDILVVRVVRGSDFFCVLKANIEYSPDAPSLLSSTAATGGKGGKGNSRALSGDEEDDEDDPRPAPTGQPANLEKEKKKGLGKMLMSGLRSLTSRSSSTSISSSSPATPSSPPPPSSPSRSSKPSSSLTPTPSNSSSSSTSSTSPSTFSPLPPPPPPTEEADFASIYPEND